ncbi:MAG: LysM repeat protein [Lentimonas sp.]|jgi:LysM repeat protein
MQHTRRQFTQKALLAAAGCTTLAQQLFAQTSVTDYIVQKGDTLGHIALRHGVRISELKQLNLLNSDTVRIGQTLKVPSNSTSVASSAASTSIHIVQQGDTLGHIALQHGTTISAIKHANKLKSDLVRMGQKLQIPAGNSPASPDLLAEVRAATANINVRRDNWKRIVVHHSAIKYGNAKKYDAAHRQRGMQNGLAYHFLIGNGIDSGDGEIEIGPRWKKQLLGGHVRSYNINLTAIGICMVGNFEQTHPSKKQLDAFTQLMDWLQGDVLKKKTQFAGHRELKGEQTICPGKKFPLAAMHARYD